MKITASAIRKKYAGLPALDFDLLLAAATEKSREFLYAHPDYRPAFGQRLKFRRFINLYKKGYSVAAITGRKEFCGLDFFVDRKVLIPRPETELLVENAAEQIRETQDEIILIDVGTGSGCIPISIAKKTGIRNVIATDMSGAALRAAKKNARKFNVAIKLLRGDLLEPAKKYLNKGGLTITANLPYLTRAQFDSEKSIQKEPKMALIADGSDGLSVYGKLFRQIADLKKGFVLFLEIDSQQAEKITALAEKYFPGSQTEIKEDLSGRDRLAIVRKSSPNS